MVPINQHFLFVVCSFVVFCWAVAAHVEKEGKGERKKSNENKI